VADTARPAEEKPKQLSFSTLDYEHKPSFGTIQNENTLSGAESKMKKKKLNVGLTSKISN